MPRPHAGREKGGCLVSLFARWASLPRAARWLLASGAFVLGYFVVIEPGLEATARLNARADALQAATERRDALRAGRSDAAREAALAATRFGPALPPGGPERPAQLNAAVERILRDRSISALTIRTRALVPLGRSVFLGLIPESQQAQRLILDVDFESSPDTAAAIIAEMEQAPEVAALGRVILRKVERDGRKALQVSLSPEAWLIASKGGGR